MISVRIDGRNPNATKIGSVVAGERCWVRATGIWWDFYVPCTADGYPAPLFYLFGFPPRHPDGVRYMGLWGCVTSGSPPGPQNTWFRLGCEHDFMPTSDGELWVAANDREGFYWNNWGTLNVYLANAEMPSFSNDWLWTRLTDFLTKINGIPLILGLLALIGGLLGFTDVGADLMVTTAQGVRGDWMRTFWMFTGMSALLSFQCWFWSRHIIARSFGPNPNAWVLPGANAEAPAALLVWGPRALGLIPFIMGLIGFVRAGASLDRELMFSAVGLALFVVYTARRRLFGWRIRKRGAPPPSQAKNQKRARISAYIGALLGVASVLAALAFLIAFSVDPVRPAQWLGPAAVVYLAVSLMIPTLAGLSSVFSITHFPLIVALIFLGLVLGPLTDDHEVGRRVVHEASRIPSAPVGGRPTLKAAFDAWQARQTDGDKDTVVLVSAQGGASRAGYWTALVLSQLDDIARKKGLPPFSDRVFAISSVSGGSVGAAGYVADAARTAPLGRDDPTPPEHRLAAKLNEADFLSPALGGLLFPDLVYRFFPLPGLPDRAEALEEGWEKRWRDILPKTDTFSEPFQNLWRGEFNPVGATPRWVPLLLINGTREEDGRRVITAPINIDPNVFLDAVDFYAVHPADIRLSTAVHNSARFPLISPPGGLSRTGGHIIDGGYFDNSGTQTLRDVLQALLGYDPKLKPIIVEINNDDSAWTPSFRRTGRYAESDETMLAWSGFWRWANDILGPLLGLDKVRGSHETITALSLARFGPQTPSPQLPPQAPQPQSAYVFAHLYPYKNKGLPVNWVLSDDSMARAQEVVGLGDRQDPCGVRRALEAVIDAIRPGPPASPAISDPPCICDRR
jgi:hypothetical protein